MDSIDQYDARLEDKRTEFAERALQPLLSQKDQAKLLKFWINFSSRGVPTTERVVSWICRAGEKCRQSGFAKLGESLCRHAEHEAGHHEMMIEDTKTLVAMWNEKYSPAMSAEALLDNYPTQAVIDYQQLHEDCIDSDTPFGQIAIEYEIENISGNFGKQIIMHTTDVLGDEVLKGLTFLCDHAELDVGHTKYNRLALAAFLADNPDALSALTQYGARALDTYGGIMRDHAMNAFS